MKKSFRYFVSRNSINKFQPLTKMKKIFTLLVVVLLTGISAANAQSTDKASPSENRIMVYSEEDEAMVYKNDSQINSGEIIIESLPGFGLEPVPVEVSQNEKGSYTFKKHPSLIVPEYYTVVITDSLTGKQFNLKAVDSFTFDVAKATPDRFVLQMTKTKYSLTAMH